MRVTGLSLLSTTSRRTSAGLSQKNGTVVLRRCRLTTFTHASRHIISNSIRKFSADGKVLYVTASEHGHAKIFKIFLHPTWKHATPEVVIDAHSNHGIQVLYHSGPDTFAFTQSSYKGPNNVFLQSGDSKLAQITHFGKKELKEKDIPNAESFWFHSEGNHVQGWSFPPPGYDAKSDKKYPGLLLIHGGPQGAWEDGWSTRWNPAVFAAQGYWVIAINPTGSTGFGQAFTDAITKDWGGRPFVDLRKGWAYALKHFPVGHDIESWRTVSNFRILDPD